MNELLSMREVCEVLGVHPNTLRNWDKNDTLSAVRLGPKKIRKWKKEDVMRLAQIEHIKQEIDDGNPEVSAFRRLFWDESVHLLKDSSNFINFSEFRQFLIDNLPQNSIKTRKRMASAIFHWFFPELSLDTLSSRIWKSYKNDELLMASMRYEYFRNDRTASAIYLDKFFPLSEETLFPAEYIDRIVDEYFPDSQGKKNNRKHIRASFQDIGIIDIRQDRFKVCVSKSPDLAYLIILHYLFSTTPQTTSIKTILENPFWKYLGARSPDVLRRILMKAEESNLLRYVMADQLEQVTTRYSFEEFVECKCRI